jgi:hypothetical protein
MIYKEIYFFKESGLKQTAIEIEIQNLPLFACS